MLSKKERRRRRQNKKVRQNKANRLKRARWAENHPVPWEPVKLSYFQAPDIFKSEVTKEQRLAAIRGIGAKAQEDFEKKYPAIEKWFEDFDAVYLLSFCSYYFLTHQEGVDLEALGKQEFFPYFVEIMQAFALSRERSLLPTPLLDKAETLKNDMSELGQLMGLRLLKIPEELTSDEDIHAYHLRTEMMGHTIAVRNWAYLHQIRRITTDLGAVVSSEFRTVYGVSSTDFLKALFGLLEQRNDLLNEHLGKVGSFIRTGNHRELLLAYNAAFPDVKPIVGDSIELIWQHAGRKIKRLKTMLMCHSDLRLPDIFSFRKQDLKPFTSSADLEALFNLFTSLSLEFGALKEFKKEHIILSNPVHSKPFITLADGSFFSSIWVILAHYALSIFEDLVSKDTQLKILYGKRKAAYLEDTLEALCRDAFPSAQVHRGSLWNDPKSGKQYENDVLVVIGSFAIILEAKSGSVSDPARRGAPDRLERTLQELIEEPSEQALRFLEFLKHSPKLHALNTKRGVINRIDSTPIKYYIPIGITLSELGMISSNLKKLVAARVVNKNLDELAPSMSLSDFEIILSVLPSEAQRIHYLSRRREIEAHFDYEGDEMDLLSFYLDHGFNIGATEYSNDTAINISMKSKQLDPFVIGSNEGRAIPRPKLKMTKWWEDILQRIEQVKSESWLETAYILLNTSQEDQEKFEREFERLASRVRKGMTKDPHNWVVCLAGPERRRYAIIGYPITETERDGRKQMIGTILDDKAFDSVRGAVVIGVDMTLKHYPYSILGRRLSTNLFDVLTVGRSAPN